MAGHDIHTPWDDAPAGTDTPPQDDTPPQGDTSQDLPPPNEVPVATADSYQTAHNTPLVVAATHGVLANDSDDDGDALIAAVVDGPSHGSLLLNSDGSFTYAPTAGLSGLDSFLYKANDGSANSDTVEVNINVAAPPPDPLAGDNTLVGTSLADNFEGRGGNDVIYGQGGNDRLDGGVDNDKLNGGAGNDLLIGGAGNDVHFGGLGRDSMSGGLGADRFVFAATSETPGSPRDVIVDFNPVLDRIDLSAIDANGSLSGNQAFKFLPAAGAKFTAAGQLHFIYTAVGGVQHTIIEGNVNKALGADFQIDLIGISRWRPMISSCSS